MRIYNGKKSSLEMPLGNGQKIVVGPQSVSGDFLPSTNFMNMLVSSFDYNEIALIVSGIQELNLCSSVSAASGFVVHSIAEAMERFSPKPVEAKEEDEVKPKENPALLKEEKPNSKKKDKKKEENKEGESQNP